MSRAEPPGLQWGLCCEGGCPSQEAPSGARLQKSCTFIPHSSWWRRGRALTKNTCTLLLAQSVAEDFFLKMQICFYLFTEKLGLPLWHVCLYVECVRLLKRPQWLGSP